jgi:hypothetical protein
MRAICLTVIVCAVLTASAQIVFDDGKPPAKARSPELEALSFLTGRWESEYVIHETPQSKEWKGKGVGVAQWSANGQFLISDFWLLIKSPDSPPNFWGAVLTVITWDPLRKEYRGTEISATLTKTTSTVIEGKKMTTRSESRDGDHVTKTTTYSERISDTEIKVRTECSIDGGPTWVFSEGTARKLPE